MQDQSVNVSLWYRLHSSNWDDWLVLDGCSEDRVSCGLARARPPPTTDSPSERSHRHALLYIWKCAPSISPQLPQVLTALLDELTAQPLPDSASGPFTRISSYVQSSSSAEVRIGSLLSRPGRPLTLADFPSPASPVDPDLHLYQTRKGPRIRRVSSLCPLPFYSTSPDSLMFAFLRIASHFFDGRPGPSWARTRSVSTLSLHA